MPPERTCAEPWRCQRSEVRYTLKTPQSGHILSLLMEEKREKLKHVGSTCIRELVRPDGGEKISTEVFINFG